MSLRPRHLSIPAIFLGAAVACAGLFDSESEAESIAVHSDHHHERAPKTWVQSEAGTLTVPKEAEDTPQSSKPVLGVSYQYKLAVESALRELNDCMGVPMHCQLADPYGRPVPIFVNINVLDWPIACETSFPFEQELFVAVDFQSAELDVSTSNFSPPFPPSFPFDSNLSSKDACETAMRFMEGQEEALELALEMEDDFLYEQGFDYDDEGGESCYSAGEQDGSDWYFLDLCETDHPLKREAWSGWIKANGDIVWDLEGAVFRVLDAHHLVDQATMIVDENIGLVEHEQDKSFEMMGDTGDTGY